MFAQIDAAKKRFQQINTSREAYYKLKLEGAQAKAAQEEKLHKLRMEVLELKHTAVNNELIRNRKLFRAKQENARLAAKHDQILRRRKELYEAEIKARANNIHAGEIDMSKQSTSEVKPPDNNYAITHSNRNDVPSSSTSLVKREPLDIPCDMVVKEESLDELDNTCDTMEKLETL
uniref:Uncharacterized protein n=1 Tax=Cacopsylla melanoneura TaxID=428564 RepID=A0A8D9DZM4_9HEMI